MIFYVFRCIGRSVPNMSVPIDAETGVGRLFVLDKPSMTLDDLLLTEIVGRMVTARLDHFYLMAQLRTAAATEERIRLARDLHDGVLQSFTGIGLRLEAIKRALTTGGDDVLADLEAAQRVIASEQRDLRFFIQELAPSTTAPTLDLAGTRQRLTSLAERMEREWSLRVDLNTQDLTHVRPDSIGREIYHIVREALFNAVRHGRATEVRVRIRNTDQRGIVVTVADNGHGSPFTGTLGHVELMQRRLGPRTLCERVTALDGSLDVESTPTGARLEVALPAAS